MKKNLRAALILLIASLFIGCSSKLESVCEYDLDKIGSIIDSSEQSDHEIFINIGMAQSGWQFFLVDNVDPSLIRNKSSDQVEVCLAVSEKNEIPVIFFRDMGILAIQKDPSVQFSPSVDREGVCGDWEIISIRR